MPKPSQLTRTRNLGATVCIIIIHTKHVTIYFRMASAIETQKQQNFLRLHLLLLKITTRVVRAKFDSFVPPGQIKIWLPKEKDLKKANIKDYQIKHLKKNLNSQQFDLSLLIALLQHFHYKNTKPSLWNEHDNTKILPIMQCDIAQIVRIRNLRNEVCICF